MVIHRNNYLNTVEGQVSLRHCRMRKRLLISLIDIEPRSKGAISEEEKIAFQNAILIELNSLQRHYFKAPVALELDFFPTENNPPSIHTITKNYLDLLQSPLPRLRTRRKRLVLEDDRQVQYLAVNYHISPERSTPSIWLKIAPFMNLVEDTALLHKVQNNELIKRYGSYSRSHQLPVSWHEIADEEKYHSPCDDAIDQLRDYDKNKTSWVARFGEETYEVMREIQLMGMQDHILRRLALSPSRLLYLLSPLFLDNPEQLDRIHADLRNVLISPPLAVDLGHHDLKKGDSKIFKQIVKQAIAGFKERFENLFPLRVQLGVTILFQPPAIGGIDLDNLARRIIPFVDEELQPPSDLLFTIDVSKVGDSFPERQLVAMRQSLKRMSRHSVTHFQIVQLPRLTNDYEHGFVRLLFEPGENFSSLWSKLEGMADKWQEAVEQD